MPASFHTRDMIAVVNQKGGVGKTTLAVHIAVWHFEQGHRVAFIDADGQSSSSRWIKTAGWPITLFTETRPDPIIEIAKDLRATHDVIVADGPGNLAESTRALLLMADFALVPCGVTVPELESTAEMIRMIKNARLVRAGASPQASVVLTRVRNDRFVLTREAHEAAGLLGLPVCANVLRLREATADSPGQRTVVWNMGRKATVAAKEMNQLLEEIDKYARKKTDNIAGSDRRAESLSTERLAIPRVVNA